MDKSNKKPYTKPELRQHKIEMGVYGEYFVNPGERDGGGGRNGLDGRRGSHGGGRESI